MYLMFYRLSPHLVLRSPGGLTWPGRGAGPGLRTSGVFPPAIPPPASAWNSYRVLASGPCRRLLDVGCGSGVLTLAGAALGVTSVWGWTCPARRCSGPGKRPGERPGRAVQAGAGLHRVPRGSFESGPGQPALCGANG